MYAHFGTKWANLFLGPMWSTARDKVTQGFGEVETGEHSLSDPMQVCSIYIT